jgi:hypothetical protein
LCSVVLGIRRGDEGGIEGSFQSPSMPRKPYSGDPTAKIPRGERLHKDQRAAARHNAPSASAMTTIPASCRIGTSRTVDEQIPVHLGNIVTNSQPSFRSPEEEEEEEEGPTTRRRSKNERQHEPRKLGLSYSAMFINDDDVPPCSLL